MGDDSSEAPPPKPALAQRLAAPLQYRDPKRYQVMGEHGRGGLGRVARAHDKELGRNVAIKELIKRGDLGEVRFLREAMITARLEHPSIVPIHEAGRWPDGTPFYVMKLVAGRSLKELIKELPTVDARLGLLHHVIAIADAMAYAHERKIIHRDLKPGNVIAGDYGETIVIDWGLAKDLDQPGELPFSDGPHHTAARDDLTVAGSVLGTPLYMAPEQARGESVDQRADVFAIGAMLWELCSLQRDPPRDPAARERMLRRSRIDQDLIAIIGKALAADPDARYADAGELAADLKAFKSGTRIAAREYSVPALLAHWIRHHRALAAVAAVATMLVLAGTAMYVRNIGIARDRAETSQRDAVEARNTILLENAALQLARDPTAAISTLDAYRGNDRVRHDMLVAEARGRGVAQILAPHSDGISFIQQDASGAILTLGQDRKIVLTTGGESRVLASDGGPAVVPVFSYAPERKLLAYAVSPTGVAVLDVATGQRRRISNFDARVLAIAPDGAHLAAMSRKGAIIVWTLSPDAEVATHAIPNATSFVFADAKSLVVTQVKGLQRISVAGAPTASFVSETPVYAFDARGSELVTSDLDGTLSWHAPDLTVAAKLSVCKSTVTNTRLVASGGMVAFSCVEGRAGVVKYDAERRELTLAGSTMFKGMARDAIPDARGERLAVLVDEKSVHTYDLVTKLRGSFEGHGIAITAGEMSADQRHILVGDADGNLRMWKIPPRGARTVFATQADRMFSATISRDAAIVVTAGGYGVVHRVELATGKVDDLKGHTAEVMQVRASRDGRTFLTYGIDGTVRIWGRTGAEALHVLSGHRGAVHEVDYLDDGTQVVSVGDDGKLMRWSFACEAGTTLFTNETSLDRLEVLSTNQHVLVHDAAGSVWDVAPNGKSLAVGPKAGGTISILRASRDGRFLAIGRATGDVTIYNTATYSEVLRAKFARTVRQVDFDPSSRDVVIVSDAGAVIARALDGRRTLAWRDLPELGARDVAYSPDGEQLVFIGMGGNTWFYSIRDDRWTYVRDHLAAMMTGVFSLDGRAFVSTDGTSVVVRDIQPSEGPDR